MHDWIQYLSDLIGESVKVSPDDKAAERLPVFVGSAYAVLHGRVLDQAVRFLVPKRPGRPSLPDVLRDHAATAKNLDDEVVLVLPEAPAYVMKRLMRERIPFIVPGRQTYLPRYVVALRTPSPENEPHADGDDLLSPRTQALLLYHIEKKALFGHSQIEVSRLLGWTPMTVSRCVRELQRKGLCQALVGGRSSIVLLDGGRDLWERASPRLSSPVMARRFAGVLVRGTKEGLCAAGVTALSRYTTIGEDPAPSLAVHHRLVRDMVQRKVLRILPYRDDGCVALELWRYNPVPLSEDGVVDRLSLYLSLKSNPDERIEGSLRDLLEGVKW